MTMEFSRQDGRQENEQNQLGSDVGNARSERQQKWAAKTDATLVDKVEFLALKEREKLHVVGVTGFSGQWGEAKIAADPALKADYDAAQAALVGALTQLKSQYGNSLIVSSGATMEGVPKIIYDACEQLGISAMGVTSEKAYDYALGKMLFLIVEGEDWGAESPTFLETADEFLLLGGGGQAKREAIAADTQGKLVTVFQGFKGSADQLTSSDLPGAVFVPRVEA